PPFQADNPMETAFMRLLEPPRPARETAPERYISEELEAIVMRCLATDPLERFDSMDDLAERLSREEERIGGERRLLQMDATAPYTTRCRLPPVEADSPMEAAFMRLRGPPRPAGETGRERYISGGLEAIVMRCLATDPLERFDSMDDLAERLSREEERIGGGVH